MHSHAGKERIVALKSTLLAYFTFRCGGDA